MKRIAVLTSGGDTPGMNAAVRAVVKAGLDKNMIVMGIYHGFKGLLEGRIEQLQYTHVHNTITRGGTILRTARCEAFKEPEGVAHAMKVIEAYNIEGIIVIGGDGSFRGALALNKAGVATIGIPGTIDNDMGYTDYTIGFDTAVNNVILEIDKIRDTMRAHDRIGVVEVMGRNCGDIALWAGIAGPADITLLPECHISWDEAANKLAANKLKGRHTSMVIIAEGAGSAEDFARFVKEKANVEIKPVVLSYIQRGGAPSAFDRILATRLGVRSVELLASNNPGMAVGIHKNSIIEVPLEQAINTEDVFDEGLYSLNNLLTKF